VNKTRVSKIKTTNLLCARVKFQNYAFEELSTLWRWGRIAKILANMGVSTDG
jgi:hypothetical protein